MASSLPIAGLHMTSRRPCWWSSLSWWPGWRLMFWPLQLSCSAGLGPCSRSSRERHRHWQNQGHISLGYPPDCLDTVAKTMGFFRLLHCKIIFPVGQDLKFLWTHCCWQILYRVIVPSTSGINIVINGVKSHLTLISVVAESGLLKQDSCLEKKYEGLLGSFKI